MRRLVVDTNYLNDPKLRKYLEQSRSNLVVISEPTLIEIFEPRSLANVRKSLEPIRDFPSQVILLKNNGACGRMSGRRNKLTNRLIDAAGPRDLKDFCRRFFSDGRDVDRILRQRNEWSAKAKEDLIQFATDFPTVVKGLQEDFFKPTEIKSLRKREPIQLPLIDKIMEFTRTLADDLYSKWPAVTPKDGEELVNSVVFRTSLSTVLRILRWIRSGRDPATLTNIEQLRNDQLDATIATYATYFDGLLTNDRRLQDFHAELAAVVDLLVDQVEPRRAR
ncbi:hypothetical protein [Mesorhizobium sp.]|uniref:hypothetical protein n=1 Tax=Mesorhizobium sp. TaxID=1871066 RepID=UPI0012235C18|nr:hypothetical protein [Mesorhizobium sp.]TIL50464.1 MAG: hypothetical protein E5Y83_21835 [Mesorhizobium sp.]